MVNISLKAVAITALAVGVAVLAPTAGLGQDKTYKKFTATELKTLLEDLDYEAKDHKSADGKIEWVDVTRGPKFFLGRIDILDDGATLIIGVQFPGYTDRISLTTINSWNTSAVHNRAVLADSKVDNVTKKVPRIEADLDCGAGISNRVIARYLRRFEDKSKDFVAFLERSQGKTDAGPGPNAQAINVVGTTWKGKEDLAGFGELTFKFLANQVAVMVDQKQELKGGFTQDKEKVNITFNDVIYRGTMVGNTITGVAEFTKGDNKGTTWKFSVTLQPGAGANPNQIPDARLENNDRPGVAEVNFPLGATGDQVQVSWRVHYRHEPRHGLRITGAWLKRPGSPDWLKVLQDVHVTQFYVPYEDGNPRYFDMDGRIYPRHGPWKMSDVFPGRGHLVGPQGRMIDEHTVREDRDAGLLYLFTDKNFNMEKQTGGDRTGNTLVQRRQEMVLWGVYQASNYFYIMQYAFQNDGTVLCKLGSTGKNLPGHAPRESGHMHNGLWRIQFDLGGSQPGTRTQLAQLNQVSLLRHEENEAGRGKATTKAYLIERESEYKWIPEEFTALRVQNPYLKNRGSIMSYDLVPLRYGNARHYAPARTTNNVSLPSDAFTRADFWVTNDSQRTDYRDLPQYTGKPSSLDSNPVIWHISSNLHIPRNEDFIDRKNGRVEGCATVMYSGFEIRPRSVFAETPFLKESMFPSLLSVSTDNP